MLVLKKLMMMAGLLMNIFYKYFRKIDISGENMPCEDITILNYVKLFENHPLPSIQTTSFQRI